MAVFSLFVAIFHTSIPVCSILMNRQLTNDADIDMCVEQKVFPYVPEHFLWDNVVPHFCDSFGDSDKLMLFWDVLEAEFYWFFPIDELILF